MINSYTLMVRLFLSQFSNQFENYYRMLEYSWDAFGRSIDRNLTYENSLFIKL